MTTSTAKRYTFDSSIDSLAKVEQLILSLKEVHNIPEDIYGNIVVATSEGMINAIKHGNNFDSDKKVNVFFESNDNQYIFIISDNGPGFDYSNVPDPTHPDNIEKVYGRGIFIMKMLSDEVEFEMEGSKVLLKFVKV